MLPNGDEYVGEFRAGSADGHGSFHSTDDWVYVGKWAGGKMCGEGQCRWSESGVVYVGQWLANQRHGFGKQTFPDGCVYEVRLC